MAQDAEKLAEQAARLRDLKKRARVTFRQIGDAIDVTERQVQRWLAGHSEIGPENLKALADYLDTTPDFIEYGERRPGNAAPDLFPTLTPKALAAQLDRIETAVEHLTDWLVASGVLAADDEPDEPPARRQAQ